MGKKLNLVAKDKFKQQQLQLKLPKTAECQHVQLSLMRSGPDVSAYCTRCWKLVFKSKEATVWKHSLAGQFKGEDPNCPGKIVKVYRTDRFVTARCAACDFHIRGSEFKVERNSVISPRIEPLKSVWRIASTV